MWRQRCWYHLCGLGNDRYQTVWMAPGFSQLKCYELVNNHTGSSFYCSLILCLENLPILSIIMFIKFDCKSLVCVVYTFPKILVVSFDISLVSPNTLHRRFGATPWVIWTLHTLSSCQWITNVKFSRYTHVVKFVVKSASVAYRFPVVIASPKRRIAGVTIRTLNSGPTSSRLRDGKIKRNDMVCILIVKQSHKKFGGIQGVAGLKN